MYPAGKRKTPRILKIVASHNDMNPRCFVKFVAFRFGKSRIRKKEGHVQPAAARHSSVRAYANFW
jgi:hypothetical protein